MANIKNFGIKGVAGDVQLGKGGGHFIYDKANGKFILILHISSFILLYI